MPTLEQQYDEILESKFDARLEEICAALESHELSLLDSSAVKNYQVVTPNAKKHLSGLLKYYAKKAHPFTECVKDNRKRFGPKAEAVCGVLKDIIRNTTKWRGHPSQDKGAPGLAGLSEGVIFSEQSVPIIDDETADLIERLSEIELWELLGLAQLDETDIDLKEYTHQERMAMVQTGHALPDGSFPIKDKEDVDNAVKAIGRAKNKPRVKKHIITRAKKVGAHDKIPAGWEKETAHLSLAYPGIPQPQPLSQADHEYLNSLTTTAKTHMTKATKYLTSDPHPEVARLARDVLSRHGSDLHRASNLKNNKRDY